MIIDLTHCIAEKMPVFPGDSAVAFKQTSLLNKDGYSNFEMTINMHAGTHIDGPMHLINSDLYINDFSLDTFVGEGHVIDVSSETGVIQYKEEYEQLNLEKKIVIFYTGFGELFNEERYFTEYPILSKELAQFLVRKHVKMVGLDTPSPDKEPFEVHKILFNNNILILENLAKVDQLLQYKSFEIIALPLNIKADSSIARVIARVK